MLSDLTIKPRNKIGWRSNPCEIQKIPYWRGMSVNKEQRAQKNNHKPCVVWLTGLSGSGKSTIADTLERRLFALGYSTYTL